MGLGACRYVFAVLAMLLVVAPAYATISGVSVSPASVQPGGSVEIKVYADSWDHYNVEVYDPGGHEYIVTINSAGSWVFTFNVPGNAPPGTWTVKVVDYYTGRVKAQNTFTVTAPTTTHRSGSGNGLPTNISPQAPPALANAVNRILGLLMYIGWAVVLGGIIFAAIMHLVGKEAPQFLGKVIVAALILAFGFTILWWITG